jgi:hypothetical protein
MADIITFVLHDILKISTTLISHYPTVQDKLLYLILIPHIILLLFIYAFSKALVARILGGHKAIESVLLFVVYIYLIYSGIYGTVLIPLFISSFLLLLIIGVGFFVLELFFSWTRRQQFGILTREVASRVAQKYGKSKAFEKVEEEISNLKKEIALVTQKRDQAQAAGNIYMANRYQIELDNLEKRLRELEKLRDSL